MDKEFLEKCLEDGMSARQISAISGKHRNTIAYWIEKYDLKDKQKFAKTEKLYFNKIDTKEKAYLLGFLLADGHIDEKETVTINVAIEDKEIVDFFAKTFGGHVFCSTKLDKKTRVFPHATWMRRIHGIKKFIGGLRKDERHYPRIRDDLEKYMIQGFFDGDGCITWGKRKDRGRIWQKISFTSQLKILLGVQGYLANKVDISTTCRPKGKENCFILEFANKPDVLKFLSHIYDNNSFIILQRKYLKANALRLELEENGGTTKIESAIPCRAC